MTGNEPFLQKVGQRQKLTATGLAEVERLAASGMICRDIAVEIGSSRDILYRVLRHQLEAKTAYERGKARARTSDASFALVHVGGGPSPVIVIKPAGLETIEALVRASRHRDHRFRRIVITRFAPS